MFIRYMYVISLYFQVSILLLVTVAQRFLSVVTQRTLFLQRIKTHLFKISSSVLKFSSIVLPNKILILRMVEASCQFPKDIRQLVRFFFSNEPGSATPRIQSIILVYGSIHPNILCAMQDFEVKLTLHRCILLCSYRVIMKSSHSTSKMRN